MRYLPKSPDERRDMLREIGAGSIDDLFSTIPAEYRLRHDLDVPPQKGEQEIVEFFRQEAGRNAVGYTSFLGAGAYRHYRPVVIDALVQRGEFLTSYTPYQAEISQGTLQAIFEFQTMICELTGMEIANASMYDGSTAAAEAAAMARRITGRHRVLAAATLHPEYREVLATYARQQGLHGHGGGPAAAGSSDAAAIPYDAQGRLDLAALEQRLDHEQRLDNQTACVLVQSPNFFGVVEDIPAIAELAHKHGALLVVSIAEALSLGVIRPPREADIVAMEAQSFGVALSYGGPYCGVIAAKEKYLRQMPGRLAGQARDANGRRGFVLTLATREQHIRREKATSNICTNQALVALMATIFLTVYGRQGIHELAVQNLSKAHYAARSFREAGAEVLFAASPRFHEFVLRTAEPPEQMNERLLEKKIIGGLPLGRWYPELGNASLWCVTELNTAAEIESTARLFRHAPEAILTRA